MGLAEMTEPKLCRVTTLSALLVDSHAVLDTASLYKEIAGQARNDGFLVFRGEA